MCNHLADRSISTTPPRRVLCERPCEDQKDRNKKPCAPHRGYLFVENPPTGYFAP
jgi:hypothetical protein